MNFVKQRTVNIILAASCGLLLCLLAISLFSIRSRIREALQTEQNKSYCEQMSKQLADVSDDLTNDVRRYVVTGNPVHMEAYWQEVNQEKKREQAIDALEQAGLPAEEMELLVAAKQNSDLLVYVECRAMRLVAEATGIPRQDMPPEVGDYVLNVVEQQMTPQQKLERAREILFDDQYTFEKNTILGKVDTFKSTMQARLDEEMAQSSRRLEQMLQMQVALAAMAAALLVFAVNLVYRFFARPIGNYSRSLAQYGGGGGDYAEVGEGEVLVPEGSKETRMFADTFNKVFRQMRQAYRDKSAFLARLSHEIRTPLNTIGGYSHLLGQTDLSGEQASYVKTIRTANEILMQNLNNILDYSKLEEHRMQVEETEFAPKVMMQELETMFSYLAEKKGLTLSVVCEPGIPEALVGDGARIRQILVNLVSNGVKFTSSGGVRVTARVREREGALWFLCSVKDSGAGIREEYLETVFEPFEQAGPGVSRQYGGTGLGLPISREMAELMGGHILVKSRVGEGSTFTLEVPVGGSREAYGKRPDPAAVPQGSGAEGSGTEGGAPQGTDSIQVPHDKMTVALQEHFHPYLDYLQKNVEDANIESLEIIKDQESVFRATLGTELYDRLREALENYDMEAAQRLLALAVGQAEEETGSE